MPVSTWIIVVGSWLVLAGLTLLAFRFNRDRDGD
jgi:hypothetical protein